MMINKETKDKVDVRVKVQQVQVNICLLVKVLTAICTCRKTTLLCKAIYTLTVAKSKKRNHCRAGNINLPLLSLLLI